MTELRKLIIGQEHVVEQALTALFAGGNCLIVGVPGLAKTLLIHTLAQVLDLRFSRIQFTPDLVPSDILGAEVLETGADGSRAFRFVPGPIFGQLLMADEINRTPPKTQSALLEAMQEHRVTVQGRTYKLEEPFFVFATQNPIELEGTYPLPEAQLDRFMFQVIIDYLNEEDELEVVQTTTAIQSHAFRHAITGPDIVAFQRLVRRVPVADSVARYAVHLVRASRPASPTAPDFIKQWVTYGASTRAAQYLVLGGKARALMQGRYHVSFDDIKALAAPVLRHRILTNFHAQSERVTTDQIVERLLDAVPLPKARL
ncbi:MAG: AAA family ATPase [Gemmatimonadota bacterium]